MIIRITSSAALGSSLPSLPNPSYTWLGYDSETIRLAVIVFY